MIPTIMNAPAAEALTLEYVQQLQQRNRNNSGGSFSSCDSVPDSPVFAQSPPAGVTSLTDIGALAVALQAASLKENLNMQVDASGKTVGGSRYKTEMCRSFMETGQCKYGDKCQFAHGVHEQRAMPRHPKYKTEPCRTFHTTGYCPYGPRCHFIHNEDPLKLGAIMQSKQSYLAQQAAQEMVKQAASLRAQQQQLSALVSQVQQQLVTNIAMQNTVNAALQHNTAAATTAALPASAAMLSRVVAAPPPPQLVPVASKPSTAPVSVRPTALCDVTPRRVTLPESPSLSPICGSPVFNQSANTSIGSPVASSPRAGVIPPPGFAPISSRVSAVERSPVRSAFDFSAPCSQDSDFVSQVCYPGSVTSSLQQQQSMMDLDSSDASVTSSSSSGGYSPPSSPDSFCCSSPLDSPRMTRLPIFSQLSGSRC